MDDYQNHSERTISMGVNMKGYLEGNDAQWTYTTVIKECEDMSKEEVVRRLAETTLLLANLYRGLHLFAVKDENYKFF